MEMGSSSEPISDSLNGLTFGKKIYFEDSATSTTSNKIAAPPKKAKSLASSSTNINSSQHQITIPRCQVEGCKLDLTGAKAYYCRHKVCGTHSKSPKVVVAGIEQRFCQQCSRFHQLHEFDQGKRSCRRRLAGHNERRRKPPPGPFNSHHGRMSSSSLYEDGTRGRGFLMDFTYPRPPQPPSGNLWPRLPNVHQYQTNPDIPAAQPYMHALNHYNPEQEYYSGATDSSCALSLLSTQQQWAPPSMPGSNNGMPMAPSMGLGMASGSCLVHPYGFKNTAANNAHHHEIMQQDMCLGQVHHGGDASGQFSGELELALQGNRHCPDHGSVGGYDHSAHGMNWSL